MSSFLSLWASSRAVPRGSLPGVAAGREGLVATRIEDIATVFPEVVLSPCRPLGGPHPASSLAPSIGMAMPSPCRCLSAKLRDSVVKMNDPELGVLVGSPHFLISSRATDARPRSGPLFGLKLAAGARRARNIEADGFTARREPCGSLGHLLMAGRRPGLALDQPPRECGALLLLRVVLQRLRPRPA